MLLHSKFITTATGFISLITASSAWASSYSCTEGYRLVVRSEPKLVIVRHETDICPEVASATYHAVRALDLVRLKAVDRFESRNHGGLIDPISNSSYPNASCRRTYKLGAGENVVVWISDGIFRGDADGTLQVEYTDPKKPLETIRLKCQIDHP